MAYLCCPICCLRLPRHASAESVCPICDRPLEHASAHAALGYRLFEIMDPLPLSPTAAAVALNPNAVRPRVD
jgi:hypothetical protein